ncbi:MAG: polymorphic toxin-type HINT domain-containing protein, partial [Terrisporobacter sp.]|uniref:polymorphic toxin-type HINT domain-containing protein n=1 Tax=Terrisporobacter sp. TaxID=1965305 RepID=UPI002FCAEA64
GQSTKYYYQNDSVLYTTGSANKSTELETPDDTEIMTGVTSLNLMGASENVIATVRDISSSEGEKYYFYNKDMRESTTNVVGVEGKSEVAYEYTDFGETEIKGDENFFNEICYTGGIYDKKTGLYYLNARYYNPEDGRFLTEDTYRGENSDPSSLHLYAYCANNPIAYKDPSGHIPVWGIINAAWGAYDGYNYAKKKNLKGWKKAGAIVGGAVISTVNPFKKLKVGKVARRVSKIAKKRKSTKVIAKRVTKAAKKVAKKSKKVKKSASRTYAKVKCKITKKGCFTAGTLISTEDGLVSIEDIKEGDLVWAQDPETGEIALKPVVQTFIKETDTILYIKTAGETIEATEQHVFFIDGVGWIPASMIEEGDVVALQSGEKAEVEKIDKVVHNELITVYNFEVEDFHTYFVSDTNVLVHNACPTKGKSIKGKTKKTGSRPPNLSPKNAGRRGAFREAKRKNGIPVSQHPKNVRPNLDKRKKKQPGRVYEFKNDIEIRDDSGGHYFPDDPSQNRGSHFNDPDGNHYDYE